MKENRATFCLNNRNTLCFAAEIRHLEVQGLCIRETLLVVPVLMCTKALFHFENFPFSDCLQLGGCLDQRKALSFSPGAPGSLHHMYPTANTTQHSQRHNAQRMWQQTLPKQLETGSSPSHPSAATWLTVPLSLGVGSEVTRNWEIQEKLHVSELLLPGAWRAALVGVLLFNTNTSSPSSKIQHRDENQSSVGSHREVAPCRVKAATRTPRRGQGTGRARGQR